MLPVGAAVMPTCSKFVGSFCYNHEQAHASCEEETTIIIKRSACHHLRSYSIARFKKDITFSLIYLQRITEIKSALHIRAIIFTNIC